jgi:hypothetical protein
MTQLVNDCPERVALDLMKMIIELEAHKRTAEALADPRKYHFDLYRECAKVVSPWNDPDKPALD